MLVDAVVEVVGDYGDKRVYQVEQGVVGEQRLCCLVKVACGAEQQGVFAQEGWRKRKVAIDVCHE